MSASSASRPSRRASSKRGASDPASTRSRNGSEERQRRAGGQTLALADVLGRTEHPPGALDVLRGRGDGEHSLKRIREPFLVPDRGGEEKLLAEALAGPVRLAPDQAGPAEMAEVRSPAPACRRCPEPPKAHSRTARRRRRRDPARARGGRASLPPLRSRRRHRNALASSSARRAFSSAASRSGGV